MQKGYFTILFVQISLLSYSQHHANSYYFTNILMYENGYAQVEQNGKTGAINMKGDLVIPCIYDDLSSGDFTPCVNYGAASVKKHGHWGVVDSTGKVIVPFIYDEIECFSEYGTAIAKKDGRYGCLNSKGQVIAPFIYDNMLYLNNGLRLVLHNDKVGYLDSTGRQIIDCKYLDGLECREGLMAVNRNGRWGFINKKDSTIIPFIYDSVEPFSNGLACVSINGKSGFINHSNKVIIPFIYPEGKFLFHNGYSHITVNDKTGIINKKGDTVIPFKYENYEFDEFQAKCFMIERHLPGEDEAYALFDSTGKTITGFDYDHIYYIGNNQFIVEKQGKHGIINSKGHVIVPIEYDEFWNSDYNIFSVGKEGTLGCIDSTGKTIIPFIFSKKGTSEYFSDGAIACLFLDTLTIAPYHGTWRTINRKGQFVDHIKGTQYVRLYYENRVLGTEGRLRNFYKEGKWISRYENGKTRALITFKHGVKNGKYQLWDTTGSLIKYDIYRDDTLIKTIMSSENIYPSVLSPDIGPSDTIGFFSNGRIQYSGKHDSLRQYNRIGVWVEGDLDDNKNYFYTTGLYINGSKEGEWKHYNSGDSLLFTEVYKSDTVQYPNDTVIIFNFDGKIKEKGYMLNNMKEGLWTSYAFGEKTSESEYCLGQQCGYTKLYEDDKPRFVWGYALIQKINDSLYWSITKRQDYKKGVGYLISVPSGIWAEYYSNGQVEDSGRYEVRKTARDTLFFRKQRKGTTDYNTEVDTAINENSFSSIRAGNWVEYYKNGQLKSIGEYYPIEFTISFSEVISDSSGNFKYSTSYSPYYFKDKTWKYYNECGELIKEEYYEKMRQVKTVDYTK